MIRKITDKIKLPESTRIPFFGGWWYRVMLAIDNRSIVKEKLPENPLNTEERDEKITASLTSFPARIEYVHIAIKSIMLQSVKPDRIVLWLAEDQFPDKKLPDQLTELQKYGLEICWMNNMYSHKKYFYSIMHQSENEVVITFDDDIIYPIDCIKRLMTIHKKYPTCLVCERGQTICYEKNGEIVANPGRWQTISSIGVKNPTYSMNPSPGGGCLMPKCAFHSDAVNEDKINELAYNKNDDLWYMFMCAENKTRMIKTRKYHRIFSVVTGSQVVQLATENVVADINVEVMEGLKKAYPDAWKRIVTDKDI